VKNYLGRLGLTRKAPREALSDALEKTLNNTSGVQPLIDAQVILEDATMRMHYERTHLQYEAISAALHCLKSPEATDSHRWSERLVEFELDPEDSVDL
jgi:hypothetical protein